MDKDQAKHAAIEFLKSQVVAVLATIDLEGNPSAATIYFANDEDFTFYFITKTVTRKYKNLQHNPNVALAIGTHNIPITIQVEGKAELMEEFDKRLIALDKVARNSLLGAYGPPLNKLPESELAVYKITPTLVRFLDQTNQSEKSGEPVQIIP